MRCLATLLVRWPWTPGLVRLEHALTRELDLRATCAVHGLASPHQLPPPDPLIVTILTALALAAYVAIHAL